MGEKGQAQISPNSGLGQKEPQNLGKAYRGVTKGCPWEGCLWIYGFSKYKCCLSSYVLGQELKVHFTPWGGLPRGLDPKGGGGGKPPQQRKEPAPRVGTQLGGREGRPGVRIVT